jgi:hypothetical protein
MNLENIIFLNHLDEGKKLRLAMLDILYEYYVTPLTRHALNPDGPYSGTNQLNSASISGRI